MNDFQLHKPTIAFVAPLIVFLLVVQFYPSFAGEQQLVTDAVSQNTITYMIMLVAQIAIAASLLLYFRPIYLRHFPLKFSWLSVVVGVVGIVLWVWLCHLEIEKSIMASIGFGSTMRHVRHLIRFSTCPTRCGGLRSWCLGSWCWR